MQSPSTGPALKVDRETLREVLDASVLRALRPSAAVLCGLLLLWAVADLRWRAVVALPLAGVALFCALLLLVFVLFFRQLRLPARGANFVAAGMALLLLIHRFLSLALTLEGEQTTNLILVLVGSGFVVLSTTWLSAVVGVTLLAWLGIALATHSLAAWSLFGLELLSASALAFIVHIARIQAFRQQENLRLQNRAHIEEMERRAFQIETLFTVGHTLNAILDPDVLLDQAASLTRECFGYDYVGIFTLDPTGRSMVSRAGSGVAGKRLTEAGLSLKVGEEGLIGWVAAQRRPLCVNDVTQDARYVVAFTPDTRAELVLPLEAGGDLIGILDIHSNRSNVFRDDDVQGFQLLADQIAIAIQNASTYQEERSRRLVTETLFEIGRALSETLDLHEVLDLILENLKKLVQFDRGSVMLQQEGWLEIVAALGFPPESNPSQIRVPLKKDDVFVQIRDSKQPLRLDNVLNRTDWQNVENLPQAMSWVGLPLINAEQVVIGMLSLAREILVPFKDDEVTLAMAFAGHAALALQNARLYSQLSEAYEQLERLDQTKADFITVAAHELRTPLTILRGYSQILVKDPGICTSPTHLDMVRNIVHGASRLNEIVESMIDMAKIDGRALQYYLEPVELSVVLQRLKIQFAEALQERRLTLTIAPMADVPTLIADTDALRTVFYHLLINAIKYTPDGGWITVSAQPLPASEDWPNGAVEIVVADTGIGIDPHYHEQIFAKFFQMGEVALHSSGRTKFKGGGPGLGLAIVKGIVESHRGKVWVESPGYDEEKCPGSRFHVILPILSEELVGSDTVP
ncbi:MAG: GAF domain-containing protein [Anaerolineae bacterium]|nr:GAF domain-containing protein [Anaerolineae bacterium]